MKQLPWILISIMLLAALIYRECSRKPIEVAKEITHTETIKGDPYPVPYPVIEKVKVDSIVYRDRLIYKEIPTNVDTSAILADYFAEIYGNQVLADDTSIFVSFDYMVTRNRIAYLKPYIQNRRVKIVNHYNVIQGEKKPFTVAVGGSGYVSPLASDVGPSVRISIKKWELSYGYGFGGSHMVGVWWSLN